MSSSTASSHPALEADAHLLICCACGTQYPYTASHPRSNAENGTFDCLICLDDRQFVPPATGQRWTTLWTMTTGKSEERVCSSEEIRGPVKEGGERHEMEIVPDEEDPRMSYIVTKPSFGIAQTPILLESSFGSIIWDCSAFISETFVKDLKARDIKAIAISHPHFYSTSLTWSRALNVPLFIASADRQWYQRLEDVKEGEIVWYDETADLLEGSAAVVKAIRCGGHFPGSACLFWDRSREPETGNFNASSGTVAAQRTGLLLCADTAMVQPHQRGFTFQWSVPNMIPMNPKEIVAIYRRLEPYAFDQASSTWQNRFIRSGAKQTLQRSVRQQLASQGVRWNEETDALHFTLGTGAMGGLEPSKEQMNF